MKTLRLIESYMRLLEQDVDIEETDVEVDVDQLQLDMFGDPDLSNEHIMKEILNV